MIWLIIYLLVGLGVFVGGRESGASVWLAGSVAVTWPLVALYRVGRAVA